MEYHLGGSKNIENQIKDALYPRPEVVGRAYVFKVTLFHGPFILEAIRSGKLKVTDEMTQFLREELVAVLLYNASASSFEE